MKKSVFLKIYPIIFTLIVCLCASLLCIAALESQAVSCTKLPDPKPAAEEFFTALCSGESEKCDSLLANYSSLGLDSDVGDGYSEKLFALLKDSYSFELVGEPSVEALEAVQTVNFTFLSIPLLEEDLSKRAYSLADIDQIKNSQDSEATAQAIENAMSKALDLIKSDIENYYTTQQIEVRLVYAEGCWLIMLDETLYNAIIGSAQDIAQ